MDNLQSQISAMDVPSHKADLTRPGNVQWIIVNLPKRNSAHPAFKETMYRLRDLAEKQNLLSGSEKKKLNDYLRGLE